MNIIKNCGECPAIKILKELQANDLKLKELQAKHVNFIKRSQLILIFPN